MFVSIDSRNRFSKQIQLSGGLNRREDNFQKHFQTRRVEWDSPTADISGTSRWVASRTPRLFADVPKTNTLGFRSAQCSIGNPKRNYFVACPDSSFGFQSKFAARIIVQVYFKRNPRIALALTTKSVKINALNDRKNYIRYSLLSLPPVSTSPGVGVKNRRNAPSLDYVEIARGANTPIKRFRTTNTEWIE